MKKLYIIREINCFDTLDTGIYPKGAKSVATHLHNSIFTYIKVGYMHQKKLSLTAVELHFFTVELHFLQLNFTFLPLNFTSYNWTSLITIELHFLQLNFTYLPLNFTFLV